MTIDIAACDAWRHAYDDMTVEQQREFYDQVYREYPEQSHFNAWRLADVIRGRQPRTVVELGGWDGACAAVMLPLFPCIQTWVNVEISRLAGAAGPDDPRYMPVSPDDWYWDSRWTADLFVTNHTVEHLKGRDVRATIAATDAKTLYIDTPIDEEGHQWWGTITTHILELGWRDVDRICDENGYRLDFRKTHPLEARSGGWSAVSVYERKEADT